VEESFGKTNFSDSFFEKTINVKASLSMIRMPEEKKGLH